MAPLALLVLSSEEGEEGLGEEYTTLLISSYAAALHCTAASIVIVQRSSIGVPSRRRRRDEGRDGHGDLPSSWVGFIFSDYYADLKLPFFFF